MKKQTDNTQQKFEELQKFRQEVQDANDYRAFVKQVEEDKEKQMNKDHLLYLKRQKEKGDKEQDRYYKYYQNFDKKMNQTLDDHDKYMKPIIQQQQTQEEIEAQNLQQREKEIDAKLAAEEQKKIQDWRNTKYDNQKLIEEQRKRVYMDEIETKHD